MKDELTRLRMIAEAVRCSIGDLADEPGIEDIWKMADRLVVGLSDLEKEINHQLKDAYREDERLRGMHTDGTLKPQKFLARLKT